MNFITEDAIGVKQYLSESPDRSCGAAASFVGIVRNHQDGKSVERLYYECYRPMAELLIAQIVGRIQKEHQVHSIRILHRIGWLEVGDAAVIIEVHAAHRGEAFSACRAVIEAVKAEVPIWKKEIYTDGTSDWILYGQHAEALQK